jgi:hypothetical protein
LELGSIAERFKATSNREFLQFTRIRPNPNPLRLSKLETASLQGAQSANQEKGLRVSLVLEKPMRNCTAAADGTHVLSQENYRYLFRWVVANTLSLGRLYFSAASWASISLNWERTSPSCSRFISKRTFQRHHDGKQRRAREGMVTERTAPLTSAARIGHGPREK